MFEPMTQPVISRRAFAGRVLKSVFFASAVILVSLCAGMIGYHELESLAWIDAFVNAAMLLSGMGPLFNPQTYAGKLFAGLNALYSGLLIVAVTALMLAPVFHRFLHRFHLDSAKN